MLIRLSGEEKLSGIARIEEPEESDEVTEPDGETPEAPSAADSEE